MQIVGNKYLTFREKINGQYYVVKSMDYSKNRERVLCFREYLGYRLGRILGLDIPFTKLAIHPTYGRISKQVFIDHCRSITDYEKDRLVHTHLGRQILFFDLLICNHDRRNENILTDNQRILPIDFNVAFNFSEHYDYLSAFKYIVMTWFGIRNLVRMRKIDLSIYSGQVELITALLTDDILLHLVKSVDKRFCNQIEKEEILIGLRKSRDLIATFLNQFWDKVILSDYYIMEVNKYYEKRKKT